MKVSVYTRDGRNASSSYYRIIQYFDILNKNKRNWNIKMRFFCPKFLTQLQYNTSGIWGGIVRVFYHFSVLICSLIFFSIDIISHPDVVILLRSITPKTCFFPVSYLYSTMLKKSKRVIWDFDDDIFIQEIGKRERDIIFKEVDDIVVTHEYLRDLLPDKQRNCVHILPTTDGDFRNYDIKNIIGRRLETYDNSFSIVWLASSAGLKDIISICDCLEEIGNELLTQFNKRIKLNVVCNKPLLYDFKTVELNNIKWNRNVAKQILLKSHLGIMPLINNKFALGKGGFKLVQYYAIGLPGIGSDVGYNKTIIENGINGYLVSDSDGWKKSIRKLAIDNEEWYKLSLNAFNKWKEKYDFETNLNTWVELIGDKTECEK